MIFLFFIEKSANRELKEDVDRATGRMAKSMAKLELIEKKIAYSDLFMQSKVSYWETRIYVKRDSGLADDGRLMQMTFISQSHDIIYTL